MSDNKSIIEVEDSTLNGTYKTLIESGSNQTFDKMVLRNTLALNSVRLRIDEDDDDTITIEPGEKLTLGGFGRLRGRKIEAKTETAIAQTFKINLFS